MVEDSSHLRFLTPQEASLLAQISTDSSGAPELQLFGNRAGLLSLANCAFWLYFNAERRAVLSLAELPCLDPASRKVTILASDADDSGSYGILRIAPDASVEWVIPEDSLFRFAWLVHSLVCRPGHEYDRFEVEPASSLLLQVRMIDVQHWL